MIEELKIWIKKKFQCSLPQIYYDMLTSCKLQEYKNINKKLPERLIEVLGERGGKYVSRRINFEDRGTRISWIVRSFLDYSESLKQYKECQEIKKLKNNYLPFMQSITTMDYICIKCGGKFLVSREKEDGATI